MEVLEQLCGVIEALPELEVFDLVALSDFAVQLRYDFAVWPTQAEAHEALSVAEVVRTVIVARLSLDEG